MVVEVEWEEIGELKDEEKTILGEEELVLLLGKEEEMSSSDAKESWSDVGGAR